MSEMSHGEGREGPGAEIVQFPGKGGEKFDPDEALTSDLEQPLEAGELFREENIEWFLTELAHPARRNQDPAVLAAFVLKYLKPFLTQNEQAALSLQDIDRRKALIGLSVETVVMPDDEIEAFKERDEVYKALDDARVSLDRNDPGARERRQAMLTLEELRLGIVTARIASDDTHWAEITRRLG